MHYIISYNQLFSLLDSIFSDLSVTRIRSRNYTYAYIIESDNTKMFYYENGSLNVNPDFIESLHKFAPFKINKGVAITIAKWIRSKTGLKVKVILIDDEEYNIGASLNESFDKLRARRLIHIAEEYMDQLNPNDVCNYWSSDEADDYVKEIMSEMVRFITDAYLDVSSEDWMEIYGNIYELLNNLGYRKEVINFFYHSLENCNVNESEEKELKKFNKSAVNNYCKYGENIESLARMYLKDMENSICDLTCICSEVNGEENYFVLIISSNYFNSKFEIKLQEFIRRFLPVSVLVMANTNPNCNKPD